MKMPKQTKKLDPKILHELLPLTLLAFIVGVGGVWAINNYITNNQFVILGYIIVFWFLFQSKFVEIVRGPDYFEKKRKDKQTKSKDTKKKYGGKPR
ncbi:MAG: hypothetical protein KO463_01490 [Candidatus Methanofastidiosa archaeon]|nr:hypothetical protein [Candidatus Methanofastidiosa archaeon]